MKNPVLEGRYRSWSESIQKTRVWPRGESTTSVSSRSAELSEKVIDQYFENLKTTLEGVPAADIVNYDETGFSDDPGKSKAIFRRGSRTSERVIDHSKVNTSVMFAISASGRTLPPYIL